MKEGMPKFFVVGFILVSAFLEKFTILSLKHIPVSFPPVVEMHFRNLITTPFIQYTPLSNLICHRVIFQDFQVPVLQKLFPGLVYIMVLDLVVKYDVTCHISH